MASDDMDLKTFIASTIAQIIEGVAEAQTMTQGHESARINPAAADENYTEPTPVAFDVAVTVKETEAGSGGAGISVAMFKLGGRLETAAASEAISRIQFSVPISLPITHREHQLKPHEWAPLPGSRI